MQCRTRIWRAPAARAVATAVSISSNEAMPEEMINGLPVRAQSSINPISTISGEAILYAGALSDTSNVTAVGSKCA